MFPVPQPIPSNQNSSSSNSFFSMPMPTPATTTTTATTKIESIHNSNISIPSHSSSFTNIIPHQTTASQLLSNYLSLNSPRLSPEISRILFIKSLPFEFSPSEYYLLFGQYGAIRQIRIGNTQSTRGKAIVVYEDIMDSKSALEGLNGFYVKGRYLVVLYHSPIRAARNKKLEEFNSKNDKSTNNTAAAAAKKESAGTEEEKFEHSGPGRQKKQRLEL